MWGQVIGWTLWAIVVSASVLALVQWARERVWRGDVQ